MVNLQCIPTLSNSKLLILNSILLNTMFNSRTTRDRHLRLACRAAAEKLKQSGKLPSGSIVLTRRNLRKIAGDVAQMSAPQYYVDQIYAYNVMSAYFRGHPLPGRGCTGRKWREIAGHVTRRRHTHPQEALIDSVARVLAETPASNFFLSEAAIRRFILTSDNVI